MFGFGVLEPTLDFIAIIAKFYYFSRSKLSSFHTFQIGNCANGRLLGEHYTTCLVRGRLYMTINAPPSSLSSLPPPSTATTVIASSPTTSQQPERGRDDNTLVESVVGSVVGAVGSFIVTAALAYAAKKKLLPKLCQHNPSVEKEEKKHEEQEVGRL